MSTKSRKSARAVVRLVARYRSPTVFEFVEEECYDLSVGGMFIKSPAPAPAGTLLKLECDVRGEDKTIKGVARVVWIREGETAEGPSGMGVKFVKLEADGPETIESIIATVGDAGLNPEEEALRGTGVSAPPPEAAIASGHPETRQSGAPASGALADATPAAQANGPSDKRAAPQDEDTLEADADHGAHKPASERPAAAATSEKPQPASPAPDGERGRPGRDAQPSSGAAAVQEEHTESGGGRGWLVGVAVAAALVAVIAVRSGGSPGGEEGAEGGQEMPAAADDHVAHTTAAIEDTPPPGEPLAPAVNPEAPDTAAEPGTPNTVGQEEAEEAEEAEGSPGADGPPTGTDQDETGDVSGTPDEAAPEEAPADGKAEEADAKDTEAAEAPSAEADSADGPKAQGTAGGTYVLEVITTPRGATVVVGEKKIVAPGTLELGSLSGPIRVEAHKPGHKPTAATIDPSMFEEEEGKMHKRIYLSLKPE